MLAYVQALHLMVIRPVQHVLSVKQQSTTGSLLIIAIGCQFTHPVSLKIDGQIRPGYDPSRFARDGIGSPLLHPS